MSESALEQSNTPVIHPVLVRCRGASEAAERLGFTCLDRVWHGSKVPYRFRCRQGHIFAKKLRALVISQYGRCPICRSGAHTERLHAAARAAGVTCLEPAWLGSKTMHRFRCTRGHEWTRDGNTVLRHHAGCPQCSYEARSIKQRLRDGLERLQQAAAQRGGACLASEYAGVDQVYPFRCAQGHTWSSRGGQILHSGNWCPVCQNQQRSGRNLLEDGLAQLQAKAQAHGGQCLESVYRGTSHYHRFRCRAGHTWRTIGSSILRGNWCPICGFDGVRLGLGYAQQLALARGGECLSTSYKDVRKTKMQWRCQHGHVWWTSLRVIQMGSWCPSCANLQRIISRKSKARRRYLPASTGTRQSPAKGT